MLVLEKLKSLKSFKQEVDSERSVRQQVLNCDETCIYWNKMPKRTYITKEDKTVSGHKPIKDRFTLLFFCYLSFSSFNLLFGIFNCLDIP